jgi:hypothetical protein
MTAQRCRSAQLVYYDRRPGSALCFMSWSWCVVHCGVFSFYLVLLVLLAFSFFSVFII